MQEAQNNTDNPILKATIYRALFFGLSILLQLATTAIYSRAITLDERATLVLILTFSSIGFPLLNLGLCSIVPPATRGIPKQIDLFLKTYLLKSYLIPSILIAINLTLMLCFKDLDILATSLNTLILYSSLSLRSFASGKCISLGATTLESFLTFIANSFLTIIAWTLFNNSQLTLQTYLIAHSTSACLPAIIILAIPSKKLRKSENIPIDQSSEHVSHIPMGLRSILHTSLTIAKRRIDVLLVYILLPGEIKGLYSTLVTISQYSLAPSNIFGQILVSRSARSQDSGNAILYKSTSIFTIISILIVILIYFSGDTLWKILFGEKYSPAYNYFPFFAIYLLITPAENLFSYWLTGKGFPTNLIRSSLIAIITAIILGIPLTIMSEGEGTAIAMSISSIASFVYIYRTTKTNK